MDRFAVMLATFALWLLAPTLGVRVDHAALESFTPHAFSNAPARVLPEAIVGSTAFALPARPGPVAGGLRSGTHLWDLKSTKGARGDSFGLSDLSRDLLDRVKSSNVTFFQGEVGDMQMRFGVATGPLLPQPLLIAERLEGKGRKATWVPLPLQGYIRERESGANAELPDAELTKAEGEVAQELLGTWTPPLTFVVEVVRSLKVTWAPRAITFSLNDQGDLVVVADAGKEAPLKPETVTFESYFTDKQQQVKARLKLDKAEQLADELKSAKSPGEAFDAVVKTARKVMDGDDDDEGGEEVSQDTTKPKDNDHAKDVHKLATAKDKDEKTERAMEKQVVEDAQEAGKAQADEPGKIAGSDMEMLEREIVENVKASNVTFFQGQVGDMELRFGIAAGPLLPQPLLIAERLEGHGNTSAWVSLPLQGYIRQRTSNDNAELLDAWWTKDEAEVAQELLGTWTPPSTLVAEVVKGFSWTPSSIIFSLDARGDLVVEVEGETEAPLRPENVTIEAYFTDKQQQVKSRLKLDKAEQLADQLRSAKNPAEAWAMALDMVRKLTDGDDDEEGEEHVAEDMKKAEGKEQTPQVAITEQAKDKGVAEKAKADDPSQVDGGDMEILERVKTTNVTFFQGQVGGIQLRFGVANSKLLPQPLLIVERLEGQGSKATWVSLPLQGYIRQRQSSDNARLLDVWWTKGEVEVAQELLGSWSPPSQAVAAVVKGLKLTWAPNSITFSVDAQGALVVEVEGDTQAPLKPENVTFDAYFTDKQDQVKARLKLDKAEQLADELKSAKSPAEAWDAVFNMARKVMDGDEDEGAEKEVAKGARSAKEHADEIDAGESTDKDVPDNARQAEKAKASDPSRGDSEDKEVLERVKNSNVTFFQGEFGGVGMRFGVANSQLLPQPFLIAERLEGEGNKATWVSMPLQGYIRQQRKWGDVVEIPDAGWTKAETELARELLGSWKQPTTILPQMVQAMGLTMAGPSAVTFSLDTNGNLVVKAEGDLQTSLRPQNVTFDTYFSDKREQAKARLKLDKAEQLADELKSAKSPTEAWDAVFSMARKVMDGDEDKGADEAVAQEPKIEKVKDVAGEGNKAQEAKAGDPSKVDGEDIEVLEMVRASKATFFQGELGGSDMRFGVANAQLLPQPILIAERLEGEGSKATWVPMPVQGYIRQRKSGDSAELLDAWWTKAEAGVAQELLGTWSPPLKAVAEVAQAMKLTWSPTEITFSLDAQGDLVVETEGDPKASLKPQNVTFDAYFRDKQELVKARLKLDKAEQLADELRSAKSPAEAWDAVFGMARKVMDGDDGEESGGEVAEEIETRDDKGSKDKEGRKKGGKKGAGKNK